MHHYTYIIQHKKTEMRYIGVRSSHCIPTEDKDYWGSSKHLPKDIRDTHSKIILKEHLSRKEAVAHEVYLHMLNSVALNLNYYNRSCQKTTGFDTSGTKLETFTETHRKNLSLANKAYASRSDYVNPRKGVIVSLESRAKNSASKKADKRPSHIKAPRFTPWFITDNNVTHLFYTTTKQDYALQQGLPSATYRMLATASKGIKPRNRGKYKGLIVGNIPTLI